jgi:hypothetical protein
MVFMQQLYTANILLYCLIPSSHTANRSVMYLGLSKATPFVNCNTVCHYYLSLL